MCSRGTGGSAEGEKRRGKRGGFGARWFYFYFPTLPRAQSTGPGQIRQDRIDEAFLFGWSGWSGMCVCRVSMDGMVWSVRSLYVRDIEERVCLHTLIH